MIQKILFLLVFIFPILGKAQNINELNALVNQIADGDMKK